MTTTTALRYFAVIGLTRVEEISHDDYQLYQRIDSDAWLEGWCREVLGVNYRSVALYVTAADSPEAAKAQAIEAE